ncbi:MAG TPA: Fic family protein [Tepidisphaeraceae bacterium]|nr:Fic family protein [Tepidisphaeraceae bacterium]
MQDGSDLAFAASRSKKEVTNYFAGLRFIERSTRKKILNHEDVFRLHKVIAVGVMEQGEPGKYRSVRVKVGSYVPPRPQDVSGLMRELLEWWNLESPNLSPVLSSAIIHYRFEAIHPFADGNGRTGRALALWELYRRGFDTHHIFSVDEFYWEDRARYYSQLDITHKNGEDLTSWLEYSAEGLQLTLERVWKRIQEFAGNQGKKKLILRPRQEALLQMLRDRGSASPQEIWKSLGISRQGAIDLLRPLLQAKLVKRVGTHKSGKYVLNRPG